MSKLLYDNCHNNHCYTETYTGMVYAYETIIECHFVTIRHRCRVRSRMRNTKRTNQKYGLQDITERRRHGERLWTMI